MDRGTKRKNRLLHLYAYPSQEIRVLDGNVTANNLYPQRVMAYQITDTTSNPDWFYVQKRIRKLSGPPRKHESAAEHASRLRSLNWLRTLDLGSSFWTVRQSSELTSPYVRAVDVQINSFKRLTWIGTFFAAIYGDIGPSHSIWPTSPSLASERDLLRVAGTKAISNTIPTKPMYSLANFLGELYNDGLPSLVGSTVFRSKTLAQKGKALGSEYLNAEFGWKPFVSDLTDLCQTVVKARSALLQYERDSGRMVGRTFEFPLETSTTTEILAPGPPYPALDGTFYNGSALKERTKTRIITRRTWFTGTYQYYLPTVDDSRTALLLYASKAEKLLGLRLTPEVLWNLAPWSWLSDWFVNYGNIFTNISALSKDNCVIRRAYIMRETHTEDTYTHPGVSLKGWGNTGFLSQTFRTSSKMRRRASPYGFGVTWTDFSPRQIAILASLGISRDWQLARHV